MHDAFGPSTLPLPLATDPKLATRIKEVFAEEKDFACVVLKACDKEIIVDIKSITVA